MFVICTVISLELAKMVSFLGHLRMARGLLNKQEQTGLVRPYNEVSVIGVAKLG